MARTGLYLSDVRKARDALLAQGQHPSVDAVRVALGNTGSKTTIHKYLKELDAEEGAAGGRKASISEALQDLVERLAGRLREESDERVAAIEAANAELARQHAESTRDFEQQLVAIKAQLLQAGSDADREAQCHAQTSANLQSEAILRHTAEQQVADLKERLAENEAHRQSLEEKHAHAREGLEHYRQSVKEQRDQDLRRHEQQIQQLQSEMRQLQQSLIAKHEDVTRLNQEGSRLASDISHSQKSLYEEQMRGRQLAHQLAEVRDAAQQVQVMAERIAGKEHLIQALEKQLMHATGQAETMSIQSRTLETALVAAQASLASHKETIAELRARAADNSAV